MIKSFLVSIFAILLFTLGGTAAWFYVQIVETKGSDSESAETQPLEANFNAGYPQGGASSVPNPIPPREEIGLPAVLRGPAIDADEMFRLSTATAAKRDQLRKYEERLREHKLRIRAADADTKTAQREVEGTLEQTRSLLNATEKLLQETQTTIEALQKKDADMERKSDDLEKLKTAAGATEVAHMKNFAEFLQSMPPDAAAETIKEMTNNGKIDFAIQLLRKIEARNVSKILAEINDPPLVAEIATRYTTAPQLR